MNRSIFRPLEKWILGLVYGVALTSALATLVGAIHPLASERPPRAIVQAARSLPASPTVRASATSNESGAGPEAGIGIAPARYQVSPTEGTRRR